MAMDNLEANSTLRIPILGDKEPGNSTAFGQILDFELNNRTRQVIHDKVCCSKKIHQFYFVKFWPYKDPDEAAKIGEAEQMIEDLDQKLFQLHREYKRTTLKWIDTHSQIRRLNNKRSSISYGLEWETRMLLDHLQLQLDKINLASKIPHKHKGQPNHTQGFRCWISHGNSNLAIERKLMKEMARRQHRLMNDLDLSSSSLQEQFEQFISWLIWEDIDKSRYTQMLENFKQIEEKKEKTLANYATKANILNSLALRNAIEEKIEIVKKMSLELRVQQHEAESEIERLSKELDPWKEKEFVYDYETQLWEMLKQKETAQRCILKLRQMFDEMNGMYDENVAVLSNAKELARNGDIAALRQLSHHQVEEFMSERNHPYVNSFRVNYEFNILDSLHNRGLSHDGRIEFQDDDQETLWYIENGSIICCLDSK